MICGKRTSWGHLVVAQHNDGSYSCSTLIFGVGAETVVAAVERDLVLSGLPESMRFQLTDFVEKDGVADHHYRQAGDAKMSATLTVMLGEPRIDDDRAVLTFFMKPERPSFGHNDHLGPARVIRAAIGQRLDVAVKRSFANLHVASRVSPRS